MVRNIPSCDPIPHMVQGYVVYPDCTDFLQQHEYVPVAESVGGCLHQNTHENCKYKTQKSAHIYTLRNNKKRDRRPYTSGKIILNTSMKWKYSN
jgi:hypothetical protein